MMFVDTTHTLLEMSPTMYKMSPSSCTQFIGMSPSSCTQYIKMYPSSCTQCIPLVAYNV